MDDIRVEEVIILHEKGFINDSIYECFMKLRALEVNRVVNEELLAHDMILDDEHHKDAKNRMR